MITGPYDLDTVKEAFGVALRIDFAFKILVNAKARCSKCERYGHYDYQCPVTTMLTDDVDDAKVVEGVHVPSTTASIIEDITVGFDTLIVDEIHTSSNSASNDIDEIVEPNTLTVPSKSFVPLY